MIIIRHFIYRIGYVCGYAVMLTAYRLGARGDCFAAILGPVGCIVGLGFIYSKETYVLDMMRQHAYAVNQLD